MLSSLKCCVIGVALAARAAALMTPDGKVVIPGAASYNGLGLTPQMGWDNCKESLVVLRVLTDLFLFRELVWL
jgi:hypothetical protein